MNTDHTLFQEDKIEPLYMHTVLDSMKAQQLASHRISYIPSCKIKVQITHR
jgi:hypothetical protein